MEPNMPSHNEGSGQSTTVDLFWQSSPCFCSVFKLLKDWSICLKGSFWSSRGDLGPYTNLNWSLGFFSFCTKIRSDCLVLDWWWVSKKIEQGSLLSTLALLNRWPFSTCSAVRLTHISDCPTEHSGLQVKLRNLPPFSTDSHSCPAYTDKVFLRFSYWRYTQTLHLHNKPPTWTHNKVLINSSGCEKNHLYP